MRCRSRSDWSEGPSCKIEKRCRSLISSTTLAATELRCEMPSNPSPNLAKIASKAHASFPEYLTGYALLLGFPGRPKRS
jgi:hypothetical protein